MTKMATRGPKLFQRVVIGGHMVAIGGNLLAKEGYMVSKEDHRSIRVDIMTPKKAIQGLLRPMGGPRVAIRGHQVAIALP